MSEPFEPKITAMVCNWCTYAGADLTGTSRIKYQSNVRVLRVPCTGRIDLMLLLMLLYFVGAGGGEKKADFTAKSSGLSFLRLNLTIAPYGKEGDH